MKKFVSVCLALVLSLSLTACGLFSTGKPESGKDKGGDIKITETYTHKDPEGMEYAKRYAYTSGKNVPELVEDFKEYYDVDFVEQFMIIYADKDNKPLAQYEYYVLTDEEQAKKCIDALGGEFTQEGNVAVMVSDAEFTQMMIDMNIQYGSLTENTASAYAEFMKEGYMFMDVE